MINQDEDVAMNHRHESRVDNEWDELASFEPLFTLQTIHMPRQHHRRREPLLDVGSALFYF